MRKRILCAAGARPNFMKVGPVLDHILRRGRLEGILVHTGQHYDANMSDAFFRDLGIREPDIHLGVGSASPGRQLAMILERMEPVIARIEPDCILVVGDVNSTLACALAAMKAAIPLAHVEAGLRSRDRAMPEELNRILTDAASDLLFTTSPDADENLVAEGIPREKIHLVGNVMIDSLRRFEERARASDVLDRLGLREKGYALVTLHRPSNVDRDEDLERVLAVLEETSRRLPVVFPVHPRTRARLEEKGKSPRFSAPGVVHLRPPEGYIDFLRLMMAARIVLTDSGGIQEETTVLGVPCLTMRENTERPITLSEGTNRLVGSDPARVLSALDEELSGASSPRPRSPGLWDGRAAERIVAILEKVFS